MKKKCYGDIQRQVTCLIPLVESCIVLIAETELTKNRLDTLFEELENFKQQTDDLNLEFSQDRDHTSQAEREAVEFKLDSLIDDLELVFNNLASFDGQIKNVVVLKEKLEAIQEERIKDLTPERIYKLLGKQQRSLNQKDVSLFKSQKNNTIERSNNSIRQKIVDLSHKLRDRQAVVSMAIIASLSLGWLAGYHSSINVRVEENKTVEATKKSTNYSADI